MFFISFIEYPVILLSYIYADTIPFLREYLLVEVMASIANASINIVMSEMLLRWVLQLKAPDTVMLMDSSVPSMYLSANQVKHSIHIVLV